MQKITTIIYEIMMGLPPSSGCEMHASEVGKSYVLRPAKKSPVVTPYCRKFVSIRHGGPRPRRYAGGRIRVVNLSSTLNSDASRNLMITVAVQLTSMSRSY